MFWQSILGLSSCRKLRTNNIHNPTLRLVHKWLGLMLFLRADIRIVREDVLVLLYAMVRKIKVSPVQPMIKQWLENVKLSGPVECISLVTRLARRVVTMLNVQMSCIPATRSYADEAYLVQGQMIFVSRLYK